MNGNDSNRNRVERQKYTVNLAELPPCQLFHVKTSPSGNITDFHVSSVSNPDCPRDRSSAGEKSRYRFLGRRPLFWLWLMAQPCLAGPAIPPAALSVFLHRQYLDETSFFSLQENAKARELQFRAHLFFTLWIGHVRNAELRSRLIPWYPPSTAPVGRFGQLWQINWIRQNHAAAWVGDKYLGLN
jgi:hypothetical protein